MNRTKKILPQRNFYPGDKWIYFKIYGGICACDCLIDSMILPVMNRLIKRKLISKWFFIRYKDPEFHLRLRMELKDVIQFGIVVRNLYDKLAKLCDSKQIEKFVIDTYSREIERYGASTIEHTENLFFIDSECIGEILKKIRRCNDNYRWMSSIYLIDDFLSCLGYDVEQKLHIVESMSQGYNQEFGFNEHNMKQLNSVYRKYRYIISSILDLSINDDDIWNDLYDIMNKRSSKIKKEIFHIKSDLSLNVCACVHMTMNRIFPSQNRFYELVIYFLLVKHYRGVIARMN